MKTTPLRQVIVAMFTAITAATVHGAWFASATATTTAPDVANIRVSTWDEYERIWTHTFLSVNAPSLIRHSEGSIVEFRTQSAGVVDEVSLPSFAEVLSLTELQDLNIPQAPEAPVDAPTMGAVGTPVYVRLRVSSVDFMSESRPLQTEPWAGPLVATDLDVNANDVNGSVGIWNVTVTADGNTDQVSFTWDIGRWAKGDVFLGLNNSTYKVIDRTGEFKRFVANADYGRTDAWGDPAGAITTGCAANWLTGEVYASNFSEMEPAVHIIGRHPGAADFPYADFSRRISTQIMRPGADFDHYPIDTAPESVVFDGNMNLYVGHSFAHWDYDAGLMVAIDGGLAEELIGNSTFVVDENGDVILMRKEGTADPLVEQMYNGTSVRLFVDGNGALEFMGPTSYAAVPNLLDLPRAFWADRHDGTWLVDGAGERVPVRWPLGKRLHRYNNTAGSGDSTYAGSESVTADRDVFWTFTGRQGTDWVDLAYAYIPEELGQPAPPMVAYYTSEDSFIHRYDVATGRQLPDFGGGRLVARNEIRDRRFHGLRVLPPGDGTGGLLVAGEDAIYRFDQHGTNIQYYQIGDDADRDDGLVQGWYTLEVDPGGRTFWASSHDSGWIYEFDIASGRELRRIQAIDYRPLDDVEFPDGRRVEGICIMWEYTAAQEICGDGVDNDSDGLTDEGCTAIESCSVNSPGDDDGDGFADANDPDCGLDNPPVAVDDGYETTQGVALMVAAGDANEVMANDYDLDNLETDALLHDDIRVHLVGTSTPNTPAGTPVTTTAGGSVTLQAGGGMLYTPPTGFHGVDTFVYQLTDYQPIVGVDTPDGINLSNVATVTITVRPLVANDSYTMPERTTLDVDAGAVNGILANDPSSPLTVSAAGPGALTALDGNPSITFGTATGATVTVYASGRFTYVPPPTFIGTDTFEYRGNDSRSDSANVATVTIIVEDVNELVAVDDSYTTPYETPLAATLTSNDSDPEGDSYRIVRIAGQPVSIGGTVNVTNGTVRLDSETTVTITPAEGFSGALSFEYTIEDTPGESSGMDPATDTALVTVTVGARPIVAQNDYYVTAQNQMLTTSTLVENQSILLNDNGAPSVYSFGLYQPSTNYFDTPLNGAPLETTTAFGGLLTLSPDGTFVYTPPLNFVGTDSFRYNVWDNTNNRSSADVFILVTPVSSTVTVSTPDPSVYGTVVTVTASVTCGADQAPTAGTVTFRLNGEVIATGVPVVNGVATATLPASLVVGTYSVQADYAGSTEEPTVCPASSGVDSHEVIRKPLTVTASPQSKVYGSVFTFAGTEFTTDGLLFDDAVQSATLVSASGTPASATVADGPYAITPSAAVGTGLSNYDISYVEGLLTVTPAPLTVQAHDKTRLEGEPNPQLDGVWTGFVNGDVVTAEYTTTATQASEAGSYPITPTPVDPDGVLANYTLEVIAGTLIIEPKVLTVTAAAVCIADTPYVTFTIEAANFVPVAGSSATVTWKDSLGAVVQTTVIPWTNTAQPLTSQVLWPGAVVDGLGNPIDWPGWLLVGGVWVQGSDGFEHTRPTSTVEISVNPSAVVTVTYPPATPECAAAPPANLPPTAVDDTATTAEDTPVTITVLNNDSDPEQGPLSVSLPSSTTSFGGTVVVNQNGTVLYSPALGYCGVDTFVYQITDASGQTDTATVTVTVTCNEPVCEIPAAPAVALVRNQSTFDGTLQGSIQLMNPVSVTLNSSAVITGQLMMVGTPNITINGTPASYGGDVFGTGATTPTNHQFMINSGATLGQLVRRVDPVALPVVTAPPAPTSTRSVTMNSSSDDPGDFATLRNLTLNSNVGPVAVPAGTYGTFIANTNTAFVLGVAGATEPTVYNFQTLTLNSGSSLQVVGPIVLNVRNSMSFNGPVGAVAHPEWLTLRVSNGDVTLNTGVPLYGYVEAPNGRVTINTSARLVGGLAADTLTINSGGLLQLVQGEPEPCSFDLVVTIDDKVKVYGDADPELTWQLTSGGPVPDGVLTGLISRVAGETVGDYAIGQGTLSASGDFTLTVIPGTLTVVPRPAVVTAGGGTKTFGDNDPDLSAIGTTGFLTDDLGAIALTQSRVAGETVGSYPTTALATGEVLSNYDVSYVAGAFTITPRTAVVTAGNGTKVYGTTDPALTAVTTTGFTGADAASLTLSQQRVAGENVGTYGTTATATGAALGNYSVSYVEGTFTITPAPLTVQAHDKTIFQGDPLPTLDGVWTGRVAGDDITAVYTTDATSASGVGTYDILPNPQDPNGALANYTLSIVPGTLTILPRTPTCAATGYTTYSQGGWGSKPSGGNPGALLAANFAAVYPDGFVRIGGSKTLTFTSASAIEKYLPAGGSSKVLSKSYTNTTSSQGTLSAQLLALQLAADFSRAGVLQGGLGDMVMKSGPLAGQSVDQILAMANTVFGGTTSALPSGMSLSGLASVLESIIMNFHDGSPNGDLMECGTPGPTPPCATVQLAFTGSSSTSGPLGNIRTFSKDGVSVKVSGFSRTKGTHGTWATAYVGVWNEGLGVTDSSEGSGSGDSHKVDNNGRLNYLLFEFSKPVVISRAYLNSIGGDSDATVWIGTAVNPFANHVTLSDAVLAGLGAPETSNGGSSARWAEFNGNEVSGNILVVAASVDQSNDAFKVSKLTVRPECGVAPPTDPVAPVIAATGGTFVYSGEPHEGTCSVLGANGAPLPGTLSYTPGAATPVAAGAYTVQCTFAGDASYLPASASAPLTITPKPALVTAGNGTKVYGTADPSLSPVTTSGFIASEVGSVVLSQSRISGESVGSYVTSATASGAVLSNYTVTYETGAFTITKAPLTVAANNKTKVQGTANPTLDGSLSGVVAGDVITATYSTTATTSSPAGTYPIAPVLVDPGNRLSNYTVTSTNGTLTVTAAAPPSDSGSGVCSGGVNKLVLKYIGSGSPGGTVSGQRTAPGTGPKLGAQVSGNSPVLYTFATKDMGGVFDPVAGGRMANQFAVFIGSTRIDDVHTSCSVPIYPGMKVGTQFEIVEVWTVGGGSFGPVSTTPPPAPTPTPEPAVTPTGSVDNYTVRRGRTLSVTAPGVLANDAPADGRTAILVSNVSRGTLTLNANGSFTYRAANGWTGNVTFTYAVKVGSATSAPITVTITVTR